MEQLGFLSPNLPPDPSSPCILQHPTAEPHPTGTSRNNSAEAFRMLAKPSLRFCSSKSLPSFPQSSSLWPSPWSYPLILASSYDSGASVYIPDIGQGLQVDTPSSGVTTAIVPSFAKRLSSTCSG